MGVEDGDEVYAMSLSVTNQIDCETLYRWCWVLSRLLQNYQGLLIGDENEKAAQRGLAAKSSKGGKSLREKVID